MSSPQFAAASLHFVHMYPTLQQVRIPLMTKQEVRCSDLANKLFVQKGRRSTANYDCPYSSGPQISVKEFLPSHSSKILLLAFTLTISQDSKPDAPEDEGSTIPVAKSRTPSHPLLYPHETTPQLPHQGVIPLRNALADKRHDRHPLYRIICIPDLIERRSSR